MTIAISMICGKHRYGFIIPFILGLVLWVGAVTPFMILAYYLIYKYCQRSALKANVVFYFITNLGCWMIWYPHTFQSFVACYELALPFAIRSLVLTYIYVYLMDFVIERITSWEGERVTT